MSADHPQRIKYTIHLNARHWWGGRVKLVIIGTGSSKKEDELLIFVGDGFHSINYTRVLRVVAETLAHEHEQ